ncbi:efflux RND transporter periplasmic adaptor subunit [bacterium]|nr:efflux RND transporter periplasmic adaptor subunit [bacterium]
MKKFALVVYAALALVGCSHPGEAPATPDASPVNVQVVTVEPSQLAGEMQYSGTVKARRQAVLATKLPGRITFLKAEEGDIVSAGSVVAEVDVSDMVARTQQAVAGRDSAQAGLQQTQAAYQQARQGVAQAKAQLMALAQQRGEAQARLDLARKDYQRYQGLAQEGAVPRQRADQALSELRVAQSRMDQLGSQIVAGQVGIRESQAGVTQAQSSIARSQAGLAEAEAGIQASSSDLAYGQVRAPFRGVVVEKNAYQGELNTPGRPLLKIQDMDSLEVSLSLPESTLERVQPGARLTAQVPALKQAVNLKVRQIVASTDPASRTFEVRLSLLNPPAQLFPGSFVRVALPQAPRKALILPLQAVVVRGQLEGAFVVGSQGQAEFRLLQLGSPVAGGREVLSGLEPGEKVVMSPGEGFKDGQKVSSQ